MPLAEGMNYHSLQCQRTCLCLGLVNNTYHWFWYSVLSLALPLQTVSLYGFSGIYIKIGFPLSEHAL